MAATLYSPAVLALATELARFPLTESLALRGSARSSLCGSQIELGLSLNDFGVITAIGLKAHACAIGQAVASLFASDALGRTRADIALSADIIAEWLTVPGKPLPDCPGFAAIAAARDYPARHGAILLPWKAALAALP